MILAALAAAAAFAAGGPVQAPVRAEAAAKRCAKAPSVKQRKACRDKRVKRSRKRRAPATAPPPKAQPTPAPTASATPTPTPTAPAPAPTPTWTPDPAAEPWFLTVYARDVGNGDFRLTPYIGEIPAGRLLLSYKNVDASAHDLWLRGAGAERRLFDISATDELRRTELTVAPGAYTFLCKVQGHEAMRLDFTAR